MQGLPTMAAKGWTLTWRTSARRLLAVLCAAGAAACCAGLRAQAPADIGGSGRGFPQASGGISDGADQMDSIQTERRLNALNSERQKSLTADADRLLKLATELNQEIAQSNAGALTPAQLRMLAEIEKLAHNVRDKMAMSLRGPQFPGMESTIPIIPQPSPH
jgi:hypothetical protein